MGKAVDEKTVIKHMKYLGVGFFVLFIILSILILLGGLLFVTYQYPILPIGGIAFLFLSYGLGRILE